MTFKEYFDGIYKNEKAIELFNFVNKLQLTYSDKMEFLRLFKNCQQDAYEARKNEPIANRMAEFKIIQEEDYATV